MTLSILPSGIAVPGCDAPSSRLGREPVDRSRTGSHSLCLEEARGVRSADETARRLLELEGEPRLEVAAMCSASTD